MALTTSAVAAGAIETIYADSVIAFHEAGVIPGLVLRKPIPRGSLSVHWSDYTQIASSAFASKTQGADQSTQTSLTTAARTATAAEYVVRIDLTDMAAWGNGDDIVGNIGLVLGNLAAAKYDYLGVTEFSGFSQTECGAGTGLALSHIFGALRQLRAAGAPAPYNLVMSDYGIWGDKGLRSLLVAPGNATTSTARPNSLMGAEGQQMLSSGFVDRIGSVSVYFCNEINDDVSSGGDSAAGMFSAGALGLGYIPWGPNGLPYRIAEERDESGRLTQYVATIAADYAEVKDAYGVYILHDVS